MCLLYCTHYIQYSFCLTINMLFLHSKDRLKLLRKIITVYCECRKNASVKCVEGKF